MKKIVYAFLSFALFSSQVWSKEPQKNDVIICIRPTRTGLLINPTMNHKSPHARVFVDKDTWIVIPIKKNKDQSKQFENIGNAFNFCVDKLKGTPSDIIEKVLEKNPETVPEAIEKKAEEYKNKGFLGLGKENKTALYLARGDATFEETSK